MKKKFNCMKWLLIAGIIIGILLGLLLYLFLSRVSHDKILDNKIYQYEKIIEKNHAELSQTRILLDSLTLEFDDQSVNLKKLKNELHVLQNQPVPDSYNLMPADSVVTEFIRRTDFN